MTMTQTDPKSSSWPRNTFAVAAVAAVALGFTGACAYTEQKPDIALRVDGLPQSAVRAEVALRTSTNEEKRFKPRFGVHGGSIDLQLAAPSSGSYTVTAEVSAYDVLDNLVATGTVSSAGAVTIPPADGNPVALQLALASIASDGAFAARCIVGDGGVQSCGTGLICVQYQGAASRGVCTQTCTGICPSSPAPASQCLANGGGQACQWQCNLGDGGTSPCPPGLQCLAQVNTTNKFCQPPP